MKTVLITGATGAIGSAVAPLFLAEPDTRVHLLLRADSTEHLQQRLQQLLEFWGDDIPDTASSRIELHRGDVSAPQLGLADDEYQTFGPESDPYCAFGR